MQPLVRELPLYILKANDLINRINNFPVPPNLLLPAMDIKSLNTGFPNNKGITSVEKKYEAFHSYLFWEKKKKTFPKIFLCCLFDQM